MEFRRLPIILPLILTTLLVSACDFSFFGADQADQAPPVGQTATSAESAALVVDRADGTLPLPLAEMALGSSDQPLLDIVYDPDANQIYATDAAGLLYIVDANDYSLRATLPAAGKITVDAARHRLFVAPNTSVYQESPQITVVDTSAFTVTQVISGSGMTHLAFDPAQT